MTEVEMLAREAVYQVYLGVITTLRDTAEIASMHAYPVDTHKR